MMQEESSCLSQHYEEQVRPCIDLVDSLRSLGVEQDLALPAIAVIGDQSSGKSSVLEALSGVALPRGTGIVTRCPLVLKLKSVSAVGTSWRGVLSYQKQKTEKITVELSDPAEVGNAIIKAQNALAEGKDISHEMINLEIHGTNVPDLTLIDLPGIARVATGNQSHDIEEKIKTLIQKFIKKQETINLVVVPANVDIATTEALKMAKTVDPDGQRSLGILTKPDLVDKGAEEGVVNTLRNEVIPLKKGYMVVKCRGQLDINDNMTLTKALDKERKFFTDHTHFNIFLDEGRASIPHLSERLTRELVSHINKITRFNKALTDIVRAEEDTSDYQPRVFSQIRNQFNVWKQILDKKATELRQHLCDEVVQFRSQRGKELPGFVSYRTFEGIVKRHVEELEEPAKELLQNTTEIISTAVNNTSKSFFEAFPNLLRAAKDPLEDLKDQEYEKAEERLTSQFKMERIIYSQDGLYSRQLQTVKSKINMKASIDADISEMTYHLLAYFTITSERLANQVPLVVQYHMLEEYTTRVGMAMMSLIKHKDADSFIQENSHIAKKRNYLLGRMERLRKARRLLAKSVPTI
ncbi:interferon-induced GTP-binding protein Mx-like isoform X2 [Engraulis encrasicolus]|uniref:interferon-induced GTP-binding protein Mx-like isoform X2 n=1 Tax=Engraulis encrasicolus TaxID=184585 RepID=UPI002FCF7946